MQEYQKRVVAEQQELNDKLVALTRFTTTEAYRKLSSHARDLMVAQHGAMAVYNNILADRIALFEAEK